MKKSRIRKTLIILLWFGILLFSGCSKKKSSGVDIPVVYAHIQPSASGTLQFTPNDSLRLVAIQKQDPYTIDRLQKMPSGADSGLVFDFGFPDLNGNIYYGFYNHQEARYAYPLYFHSPAPLRDGKAFIPIVKSLSGKYDFVGWQSTGFMRLGYRIINDRGQLLYDGVVNVEGTGPFTVAPTIVSGPFISQIHSYGAIITLDMNESLEVQVTVDETSYKTPESRHHELVINRLEPDTEYEYTVAYGSYQESYSFRTAPEPGSRSVFTFAYASDGRGNAGAGERNLKGVNAYILKKIAALTAQKQARFFQFTGDLIDGNATDPQTIRLEYANWKRTVEPYARFLPFICGMGNHEGLWHYFTDGKGQRMIIDQFPFETHSAEALFAEQFVNPLNGPDSEDGAVYDPHPRKTNFPSYKENVFYYTYDNVAMIVLNSDYWYSPTIRLHPESGGNPHGYLMDRQREWLAETLDMFEDNAAIDHVFVTQHTPVFPNGGHVANDMWWNGDNEIRPTIAGEPVEKGMIEMRDDYLNILLTHTTKLAAVLTSDEHNYSRIIVTDATDIYPPDWNGDRLEITHPIWQINNGAAGAPYYARETTPWQADVITFSTQFAVVFFHVEGDEIQVEVINPDTYELIEAYQLK